MEGNLVRFTGGDTHLYNFGDILDFVVSGAYVGQYIFQYKVLLPAVAVTLGYGFSGFAEEHHIGQTFHMFMAGYSWAVRRTALSLLGPLAAGRQHTYEWYFPGSHPRKQADMFFSDSAYVLGYLWGKYRKK